MNTRDLFRHLAKRCQNQLLGIFPADKLPRLLPNSRPLLLVCNTDPHHKPGQHWITIYLDTQKGGEFFDSFGRSPSPVFRDFMDKHCIRWTYNAIQLQSVISSFCGHYCVFYCLFKLLHYSMDSIVKCFTTDTSLNDLIVHKFVCENLT